MNKNRKFLTLITISVLALWCQSSCTKTNTLDKNQIIKKDTITILRRELPIPELLIQNKKINDLPNARLPFDKEFLVEFIFPNDPLELKGEFDLIVKSDEFELNKISDYKYSVKIKKLIKSNKAKLKTYFVFPYHVIHMPDVARTGDEFVDIYYDSTFAVSTLVFEVDSLDNFMNN